MDPDAALRDARRRFTSTDNVWIQSAEAGHMVDHWDGLDGWLSEGGFPPAEWAGPRAEMEAETQARADTRWVDQTGGLL